MNFSAQFWSQFGMLMKENGFDRHFENQDLQLTTLLEDDLIIGEFRNQNQKLMEYMQKKQVAELVSYLTEMPVDDSNSKRAFRYPFYSCELLVCCENPKILEQFFGEDRSLLHKLFQFFVSDEEVNPVLAGYVCNVLFNLLKMRTDIFLAEFYQYQNLVDGLIKQLQSRSVTELVIRLLTIEQETQVDYTPQRLQLIKGVVDRIVDTSNFEVSTNVSHIIQEITLKAYVIFKAQPLFEFLYGESIDQFCKSIVHENNFVSLASGTALYNLLTLLYKIATRQGDPAESAIFQVNQQELFNRIESHLNKWLEFLQNSEARIFGQHKVKILEIIGVCISLNQESFVTKLNELDIFKVYNSLFIKYEKHDILHLQYYRFLVHIIEQRLDSLVQSLFNQNEFIQFLLKCTSEVSNDKNQRKEYLGFVTKLAHFLEEFSSKYPFLQSELEKDTWKQFKEQYFDKAEKLNNHELGGHTRADNNEEVDFNKEDIQNKYDDFLKSNHDEKMQNESNTQNIQNIFDAFNIGSNDQSNSTDGQQQQQQDWSNFSWGQEQSQGEGTQQQDFQSFGEGEQKKEQVMEFEQQSKAAVKHDFAQEEKDDEYVRFWQFQVHEHDSKLHDDALYEFEKNY
ncbi:unnamed protein product (macronuclear) [Paramecium tetraurelia]|uniref:Serine/threonine-protein phosphatase 4 regulatory subunit 3-like central domain-containing protein n=1 Tax=Paramecium tetraurelia TaxID=5888 RepID=A0EAR2_PARTE|nr:uncharacterized protein GSPATT00025113001 [Paramecium tetraurelia]CAK92379.1 unnamed protein product [Paramecium tetraurelia]|eukprot:XP_001459776.1 hypothetical protein (macronuclear) [Paramecium tetraurelia strain d4-2]